MYCIYFVAPFFKLTDVISHYPAQGRAEGGGANGTLAPPNSFGGVHSTPTPQNSAPSQVIWGGGTFFLVNEKIIK